MWVKKYGLYQLSKSHQQADDWVIILDESVQFGQNRLLLVYGIRETNIDFTRPLIFHDLTPLVLMSRSTWTGESIAEQLKLLEKTIGRITYAVADHGNSIKKALKTMEIFHVYDITHCISLIVEHIYKNDPEFRAYTKRLAHLRATQALGKMSHVLPPAQRTIARFMNLRPISDWGMTVLNLLENAPAYLIAEKQNLKWTENYRELIQELALLNQMINEIQLILKTNGLSEKTVRLCSQILEKADRARLLKFSNELSQYLQQTLTSKPETKIKQLLCSSDIIESAFGKYKNYIHSNPMVGITNLSLSLAAFTGKLSPNELMDALQTTHVENIIDWTISCIGQTTLSKRLAALKWNEN